MGASFWTENYWITTLAAAVIIGCFFYYQNKRKFWQKFNVKGVIPIPLFGEFITMFTADRLELEKYRLKTYGKVYGTCMSGKSRLLIADPELIRQICIKDFDAFPNHQVMTYANKYQKQFLVWLQDNHWRRVRSLMTPTFTSGKIKRMFKFLQACANDLVDLFKEHIDNNKTGGDVVVNLKETFDMFTLDGIATCCYGLKLRRESNNLNLKTSATRDDFVRSSVKIFGFSIWRILLIFMMPKPILKAIGFTMTSENDFNPLVRRVSELIKKRQREPQKYDDLLQSLVDAKHSDQVELNELDQAENHHAGLTKESMIEDQNAMQESVRKSNHGATKLTELEVLSEAMLIMVAGIETTSSLLTHCIYTLAFHQKVQDRLYDELMKIYEIDSETGERSFQYESLTTCDYLDAVISETLRILPPAAHTDRVASRDYYIEKYKIQVPKGFPLILGLYAVQNDPDNWWKPEKFDPDRFLGDNKNKIVPGSYVPFSMGPRHCIGMRFSLTEAKIGLAKSIINYKFLPSPGTKFPPPTALKPGLVGLKNPAVRVQYRNPLN